MTNPYKHALRRGSFVLLILLSFLVAACGGRSEVPLATASASVLQVSVPGGVTGPMLARIRAVPGVSVTAAVSVAPVRVESPAGRAAKLNLAQVEPVSFETLAPVLLGAEGVASALNDGTLLLSRTQRERLGLREGEALTVRPAKGPAARLPVVSIGEAAAFADGIVAAGSSWLAGAKATLLFVGVAPGADGGRVASALAASLKQVVSFGPARPSIGGRAASGMFGSFSYVVHPNGTISPDPRWVRANIYGRTVPILGRVYCHRLMLPQLASALREVANRHLARLIDVRDFHTAGGCYVARTMMWDPSNPPSLHAWGLAVDINVSTNPWGARPRQDPRIVAIFKRWGFRWGGEWSPPDGMHFELAALMR
jgi:D-alanyl-D-alanine carboxypeptidase-like protein